MQLDLDKMLESNIPHPLVKKVIRKFRRDQYFTPGEFFGKLTGHDSDVLSDWVNVITDDEISERDKNEECLQVVLLTQILALAEGVYIDDEDDYVKAIKAFTVMATANNLHRKSLVLCYYDNLSFGDDAADKIIMQRLDENE